MKTLFIILFFTITYSLNAQIPSNCIIPPALQNNYDADVKHLALERIFNQNSNYKDSIDVANNYQDTIWQGLSAIFNLTSVPQRDSVFDKYCIHQEASYFIYHSIYVAVDTSNSWTQQWQNLNITTGITLLDNLLSTYGFIVSNFTNLSSINYATLTSTQNINMIPLCDSIETFTGVVYSEPKQPIGDGNDLFYSKQGNERFYSFNLGLGDCPSGCTGSYTYNFKVYDDCSVDYLGVVENIGFGDELPIPINCNITTSIKNIDENAIFSIYPNPVNNILIFSEPQKNIKIYTIQGKLILSKEEHSSSISTEELTEGIYFIKSNQGIMKFIVNH